MPIPILMPALSPTMTEGTLAKWLVKEGDTVKSGKVIAEIETDKATMEVEAVDEGRVAQLLVPAGTAGVAVNAAIAVLLEEGEKSLPAGWNAEGKVVTKTENVSPSVPAQATVTQPAATPPSANKGQRIFVSPLAKRLAGNAGIDLSTVAGTGPHGRIIKHDIELAIERTGSSAARTANMGATAAKATALTPPSASLNDPRNLADKLGMAYRFEANSGVRKVIARRLTESKQTVPHFYLTIDCKIDALLELRKKLNASNDKAKLSVNDFIIRAVALALKKIPAANGSLSDDGILFYEKADVSVAVATPAGLITPVIKAAEGKSVTQISQEMKDLATRARDGKLRPEEFQGGGFTISNLGMYGIREFAAIINPPQACILAVGAGEQRPVVDNGQIVVATLMSCTLSVDHRAVDGAVGAEFFAAYKGFIEDPLTLLV